MNRTEVLICFDTEDFTSNTSCDAIRDLAYLLQEEGIIGNFMMVGLLGQQLIRWQRRDVIDALKFHEVHFHTYGHTMHPDICESTDLEDFNEAYRIISIQEAEGIGMVKAATGRDRILASVPPGNSVSYVAMYAYADMGLPIYCDSILSTEMNGGYYFCNAFHLSYTEAFESMVFKPDFSPQDIADRLAGMQRVLLYTHPNMALYSEFWDRVNYDKENRYPFGEWKEAKRRSADSTLQYYNGIRSILQVLKRDERFCFKSLSDIESEIGQEPERILTKNQLPAIRKLLQENFTYTKNPCFSLSELFCGVTAFLCGDHEYRTGKTYGFLKEPEGVTESCQISMEGLRDAALKIHCTGFLPEIIEVDGIPLGPADYLFACLDALCDPTFVITVTPRAQQCDLNRYPKLRDFHLKNTWCHSPSLEDNFLSDRLRLQAWTIRERATH